MKVFLGGTWNESTWRQELIPLLTIDYFNPIVENWTPECQAEEIRQRQMCDFVIYTITKEMTGVYSIAEVVDDSNKRPNKTILCILEDGFTASQAKSLKAVANMVKQNGGQVFYSLRDIAKYIHNKVAQIEKDQRQHILRS